MSHTGGRLSEFDRLITVVRRAAWAISLSLLATAGDALAAGGKPATKLVNVADTRNLSGLVKWIADVYNANLWLYAVVVVVSMALLGLVLGTLFDRAMGMLGIHLGRLEHHE